LGGGGKKGDEKSRKAYQQRERKGRGGVQKKDMAAKSKTRERDIGTRSLKKKKGRMKGTQSEKKRYWVSMFGLGHEREEKKRKLKGGRGEASAWGGGRQTFTIENMFRGIGDEAEKKGKREGKT